MEQQNYANHAQRVPGFLAVGFTLLLTAIGAGVNLYQSIGDHQRLYSASLILVLTVCLFLAAFFCRNFALKAQDRAIRAEENLRHFVMTGKLLDARLTPQQIVGLRFASDEEFVELARRAAETGMGQKEIKQAVKNWRADHYRA
jgi:HAMP domain-containing protein